MKKICKNLLCVKGLQFIKGILIGFLAPIKSSINTGHFISSLKRVSLNKNREPIPWLTYPAIDFLADKNFKNASILEIGGGNSTLWWGARALNVLTFDENEIWVDKLRKKIKGNTELIFVGVDRDTQKEFVSKVLLSRNQKFDVVIIDGMNRKALYVLALDWVKLSGCIITDNSDKKDYRDVWPEANTSGFMRVDFYGLAPGTLYPHCTSIHFKSDCPYFFPDQKVFRKLSN